MLRTNEVLILAILILSIAHLVHPETANTLPATTSTYRPSTPILQQVVVFNA